MLLNLKLLEVCIFFLTQDQAMDIIRIWYIIEHRANPSTIKKFCLFTSNSENSAFFVGSTGG